jgi:hypothetical protein
MVDRLGVDVFPQHTASETRDLVLRVDLDYAKVLAQVDRKPTVGRSGGGSIVAATYKSALTTYDSDSPHTERPARDPERRQTSPLVRHHSRPLGMRQPPPLVGRELTSARWPACIPRR